MTPLLNFQYPFGHFCTIITGGKFCLAKERGIILTAFRKDLISDIQSVNQSLNSRTCIWIWKREREREREREGTDSGMTRASTYHQRF